MNELDIYKAADKSNIKKPDDLVSPTLQALAMYVEHISDLDVVSNSSAKEAASVMDTLVSLLKLVLPNHVGDDDNPEKLMAEFKELLNGKS